MTEKNNLSQVEFANLFDDKTTVKEMKVLQAKIEERFSYIMETMGDIIGYRVEWFDFDNEGGELRKGYFDRESYNDDIYYVGGFSSTKNQGFDKYHDSFPTAWLHQDFEAKLNKEMKDYKIEQQEIQEKKNKDKNHVKDIQSGILAKLTPQEQCYISLASMEDVNKALKTLKNKQKKELQEQYKKSKHKP